MKYVIVGIYHTYIDAHLSMGMLEDANISCVLKDENTVSIYPGITNAVGGIKLMVAEAQKERAIEILPVQKMKQQLNVFVPIVVHQILSALLPPQRMQAG